MAHSAKIIADSVSPLGNRLTTMEVVMPRIILAEFNTHRMFSRNSASSRAIPVQRMIDMVVDDPYIPTYWGKNQAGMAAATEINDTQRARDIWLDARNDAVISVKNLLSLDLHKQTANRLLEPFMWHTVIVTATDWGNFFHLRNHPAAHPDIQIVASLMQKLYENGLPVNLTWNDWHQPYVSYEEQADFSSGCDDSVEANHKLNKASICRCARVSVLNQDNKRDIDTDAQWTDDKLLANGHMSPFEHVARPCANQYVGNFLGWEQYRKLIPHESDILC